MTKRNINQQFSEYLDVFPITGIVGPRQVGKTTLAKNIEIEKDFLYLDLERQVDRDKLSGDPSFFLSQFQEKCVILDEVQFMPELFSEWIGRAHV